MDRSLPPADDLLGEERRILDAPWDAVSTMAFKPMGLNKSDLQRYYPEIYEQYYGEGTEDAARRKLEQEREVLERRMKDDYYNYVPKQEMKKSSKRKSGGIERRMRK